MTRSLVAGSALVLATVCCTGALARASSSPSVELDRSTVAVDDAVVLSLSGFDAPVVTAAICGNEARRGTADCNLTDAVGFQLDRPAGSQSLMFTVKRPPVGCPCVVRVSDSTGSQIAMAPISIDGVPTVGAQPGVDPEQPLRVSIGATPSTSGFFNRVAAGLGGSVTYDVTITVKNESPAVVTGIDLSTSVARGSDDDVVRISVSGPSELEPGQVWQQVASVEVPAPSIGSLVWTAVVSESGRSTGFTATTVQRPWLLAMALALLVIDLLILGTRASLRRRRRKEARVSGAV